MKTISKIRVDKMDKLITHLKDKTDDLENRSRRSNIRIINVPEKAEGRDPVGFLERLFRKSWVTITSPHLSPWKERTASGSS